MYAKQQHATDPSAGDKLEKANLYRANWNSLSPEVKAVYNATAAGQEGGPADEFSMVNGLQQISGNSSGSTRLRSEKRHWIGQLFHRIRTSPIFQCGLRVGGVDGPLNPHHVDKTFPMARICAKVKPRFDYHGTTYANPAGTMKPHRVCKIQNGGMCEKAALYDETTTIARNLYNKAVRLKNEVPLLVSFQFGDRDEYAYITKFQGILKTQRLVECSTAANNGDGGKKRIIPKHVDDAVVACAAANYFRLKFVEHGLQDLAQFSISDCVRGRTVDHFQIELADRPRLVGTLGPSVVQSRKLKQKEKGDSLLLGLSFHGSDEKLKADKGKRMDDTSTSSDEDHRTEHHSDNEVPPSESSDTESAETKPAEGEPACVPADKIADEPEEPPLPPQPAHTEIGVKYMDLAKTSRSTCFLCHTKINRGGYRVFFRTKKRSSIKHG